MTLNVSTDFTKTSRGLKSADKTTKTLKTVPSLKIIKKITSKKDHIKSAQIIK